MRLVVYDKTCVWTGGHLSPVWATGAATFRALHRFDDARGVASWDEAFAWLAARTEPIDELQYWGHGKWGMALVGNDSFGVPALSRRRAQLEAVRERLAPSALVWFRTCETLGADAGHDFAQRLADFFGARIAGHTYIIGFHQSGLHGVAPGVKPDWPADEGLAEGTPATPVRAKGSRPWAPRTVTALSGRVPSGWFASARG
jgi:hypothetical protein